MNQQTPSIVSAAGGSGGSGSDAPPASPPPAPPTHTHTAPVVINNEVLSQLFHQKPELTEYIYMELLREQLA